MQAEEVRSRTDLLEYLSQSARSTYLEGEGSDVSQVTTFLKSYIVERHLHDDGSEPVWPSVFIEHEPISNSLTRLRARKRLAFFSERINRRFCMLHTIAKTDETDAVVSSLTSGVNSWTDRAWMPSSFILDTKAGRMVGYKLASDPVRTVEFRSNRAVESTTENAAAPQTNGLDETQRGFRVASTSSAYAVEDLAAILSSHIYANRRSIDWIDTRSRLDNDVWLNSTIYSNGKVISQTPVPESHLSEVRRLTELYGGVIEGIEDNYSIRWSSGETGSVRLGEALLLEFHDYELPNLENFAETVFSGTSNFGLLGVPKSRNDRRLDVEAIDLHRGDSVSFEITRDWIRIYLPEHSCGNVICRFVWNLQRYFSSALTTRTQSGEVLFTEGSV
jgi:hypothetical protein